jgi:hypothetical protein
MGKLARGTFAAEYLEDDLPFAGHFDAGGVLQAVAVEEDDRVAWADPANDGEVVRLGAVE